MLFYQGEWYCVQCGASTEEYVAECNLCFNNIFQSEPMVQKEDNDQLTHDELELINYNIDNSLKGNICLHKN